MSILRLLARKSPRAQVDAFVGGMIGAATFGGLRAMYSRVPTQEIVIEDACIVTIRFEGDQDA